MDKHTKEPWRLGRPGTVVADEPVPDMGGADDVEYYGGHCVAESIVERNARRIVACVNACAGIPIEIIEANLSGGLPWEFAEQLDAKMLRDELLAAAKKAIAECADLVATPAGDALESAIAKAEAR